MTHVATREDAFRFRRATRRTAVGARAQVVVTGDCMWPVGCGYTGTSSVPVPIVSPVGFRNLDFIDLLPCTPTPAGVRMRESPSRASLGHETLEDLGGGSFRVTSFFDVFFELSVDNGVSWLPSSNTYHVTLTRNPPTTVRRASWTGVKAFYR